MMKGLKSVHMKKVQWELIPGSNVNCIGRFLQYIHENETSNRTLSRIRL